MSIKTAKRSKLQAFKNLRVRVSYAKIGGDYIADRVTILE